MNATAFNQLIGNWDISSVAIFANLNGATSFNQDLGGWEVSLAASMIQAFANASSFNQDPSDRKVSSVTHPSF